MFADDECRSSWNMEIYPLDFSTGSFLCSGNVYGALVDAAEEKASDDLFGYFSDYNCGPGCFRGSISQSVGSAPLLNKNFFSVVYHNMWIARIDANPHIVICYVARHA